MSTIQVGNQHRNRADNNPDVGSSLNHSQAGIDRRGKRLTQSAGEGGVRGRGGYEGTEVDAHPVE